ncbi:MAG: VWA domain-containing protein [Lachnospiraceae bacterium]|nr:VWA domain-containing protein [Lachnospiraceae bacterium]
MMKRLKGIIAFLLSVMFIVQCAQPVLAVEDHNESLDEAGKDDGPIEGADVPVNIIHIYEHGPTADGNGIEEGEQVFSESGIGTETHDLVLLLDVSGSMTDQPMAETKKACLNFITDIIGQDPKARISIVTYASSVNVYEFAGRYFTNDLTALKSAIGKITAGGSTGMNNGLQKAEEMLYKYSSADKKFIIHMTDGYPYDRDQVLDGYRGMTETGEYHILSLGFFHSLYGSDLINARDLLKAIQNSGYTEVTDGSQLTFSFSNISSFVSVKPLFLNRTMMTLYPGLTGTLKLYFTKGYHSTDKTITWKSSDPDIAKVESDGTVTGVAVGNCLITAKTVEGSVSCQIKVKEAPIKDFPTEYIFVYENYYGPESATQIYWVSKHATLSYLGSDYSSGENGMASIPLGDVGDVTISKEGYRTRTISAKKLKEEGRVRLEKESERPIIYSVRIGFTDVLTDEYTIELASNKQTKFTADIDWGKNERGSLYLAQGTKAVAFSKDTFSTVLSTNFDISDDLYLVATDKAGNAVKKKLLISAAAGDLDLEFNFGRNTSFKIPDRVPLFGGHEIALDLDALNNFFPFTVSIEKKKVRVAIGIELNGRHGEGEIDTKTGSLRSEEQVIKYCEEVKDAYKILEKYNCDPSSLAFQDVDEKATVLQKLEHEYKGARVRPKVKFGFDAEMSVFGYMEGYIADGGKVNFIEGGIILKPSIETEWSGQFFIPVPILSAIPFYWEAGIKAELETAISMRKQIGYEDSFICTINVDFTAAVKGGAGIGLHDTISAGGGITGTFNPKLQTYSDRNPYITLGADVAIYLTYTVGPFSDEWELKSKHFDIYSNGVAEGIETQSLAEDPVKGALDITNYKPMDLSYLAEESVTAQKQSALGTASDLSTNSFSAPDPKLVSFKDGTCLAVWVDAKTADYNAVQLYYAYYDGENWTAPALISDDGTLDSTPEVVATGNTAYVVWQNAEQAVGAEDDVMDLFAKTGIKVARFTAATNTFKTWELTTADDYIDMQPVIAANGEKAAVYWIKNTENQVFGSGNKNQIMTSTLENDTWSAPVKVEENVTSVMSLAAAYNGEDPVYASVRDGDGNFSDLSDAEVFFKNQKITNDEVMQSKVTFADGKLYWYQDGTLYTVADLSDTDNLKAARFLPETINLLDDRYQVLDEEGKLLVVGLYPMGVTSELVQYIYDREEDSWSRAMPVTDYQGNIGNFGATIADSRLKTIASYMEVTDSDAEMISKDLFGQTHVAVLDYNKPGSLDVTDCFYRADEIVPGSVLSTTVGIKNDATRSISEVTLQIVDEASGKVIEEQTTDQKLLPGEETDLDLNFVLPEDCIGKTYVVKAQLPGQDYADGKTASIVVSYTNAGLEKVDWGRYPDGKTLAIQGTIVNDGYSDMNDITVSLYKVDEEKIQAETGLSSSPEKTLVDSYNIDSLASMQTNPLLFDVENTDGGIYQVVITTTGKDDNSGDNEEYVVIPTPEKLQTEESSGNDQPSGLETNPQGGQTTNPDENRNKPESSQEKDEAGAVAAVNETVKEDTGDYQVLSVNPDAAKTDIAGEVSYKKVPSGKAKTVTIPEYIYIRDRKYAVTQIAPKVFAGNKTITKVVIPARIEKIGSKAFFKCIKLKQIVIKTTKLKKGSIGKAAFSKVGSKVAKKKKVTVPKKKKAAYKKLLKKAGLPTSWKF